MSKREYPDFPRVGVGAIVIRNDKVLMVKRAVLPNRNLWAIPGGMLELGETLQAGAEREIYEETGIRIKAGKPVYTYDFMEQDTEGEIRFHFVIVHLEGEYLEGTVRAADDALDARWIAPEECSRLPTSANTLTILRNLGFISP